MITLGKNFRNGWANEKKAYVVSPMYPDYFVGRELLEKATKLLTDMPYNPEDRFTREVGTPEVYTDDAAPGYLTPEDEEKAMKLLSQRRASNPEAAGPPWVVDEELLPFYVREEDEEKAMKILDYVSPKAKEKAVELHAKTEQDEFNKKPKLVNGANPQFLVVRYGWYAFAFLLEEGDVRGPELNAKAIQICEAMLTLESGGESKYLPGATKVSASGVYVFNGEQWLKIKTIPTR